jgi:adenosyl cobinamide kinase/adenosyl cobinamide phosphate guanylyltransferase
MSDKVVANTPTLNGTKSVSEITEGHAGVVIACVTEWLTCLKIEKQKTCEYLKEKAKTDIIHRSMYLMSCAEIDCLDTLLAELLDCENEGNK